MTSHISQHGNDYQRTNEVYIHCWNQYKWTNVQVLEFIPDEYLLIETLLYFVKEDKNVADSAYLSIAIENSTLRRFKR